jgi:hypothetical protein
MSDENMIVSMRLPGETLEKLRQMAHRKSLEEGIEHTWTSLVKEVIHQHLLGKTERQKGGNK